MRWHARSVLLLGSYRRCATLWNMVHLEALGEHLVFERHPILCWLHQKKTKLYFSKVARSLPRPQSWSVQMIFFAALCGDQPDQTKPYWGLDHTYVGVCSEIAFSIRFGLSSARIQIFRPLKPELLLKLLPSWRFFEIWKLEICFLFFVFLACPFCLTSSLVRDVCLCSLFFLKQQL